MCRSLGMQIWKQWACKPELPKRQRAHRGTGGCGWVTRWPWASSVPLQKRPTASWAAWGAWPPGWAGILALCSVLLRHIQDLCPDLGSQGRKGLVVLQPAQWRAAEIIKRQKNLTHGERQRKLSKLQKRRLKGYFASLYQYQMVESKGGRATLLNAAQAEIQEIQFKNDVVFPIWGWSKPVMSYPKVCMEFPSLEGLRTPLDIPQSTLLCLTLLEQRGWTGISPKVLSIPSS